MEIRAFSFLIFHFSLCFGSRAASIRRRHVAQRFRMRPPPGGLRMRANRRARRPQENNMSRVNPFAVVVSGFVFWIIQAVWYTCFRQPYIDALNLSPDQVREAMQHPSVLPYVTALLANILIAYVISIVMRQSGAVAVPRGIIVALVLWGGIVMTHLATLYSFEQRPTALLAINGGCSLIGMLTCGVICGAWKKKEEATGLSAAGA